MEQEDKKNTLNLYEALKGIINTETKRLGKRALTDTAVAQYAARILKCCINTHFHFAELSRLITGFVHWIPKSLLL